MPDWSKVGRKSRRKGKKFECEIAGLLRHWTGEDWQSTRNSGRTDLPGDIYCLSRPTLVSVECKDRKCWMTRDLLLGNVGYVNEMRKVLYEHDRFCERNGNRPLVVVAKNPLFGYFITAPRGNYGTPLFGPDQDDWPGLVCSLGHRWYLLKLGQEPHAAEVESIFYADVPD